MSDRDAVYESAIRELEEALAEVARLRELAQEAKEMVDDGTQDGRLQVFGE